MSATPHSEVVVGVVMIGELMMGLVSMVVAVVMGVELPIGDPGLGDGDTGVRGVKEGERKEWLVPSEDCRFPGSDRLGDLYLYLCPGRYGGDLERYLCVFPLCCLHSLCLEASLLILLHPL